MLTMEYSPLATPISLAPSRVQAAGRSAVPGSSLSSAIVGGLFRANFVRVSDGLEAAGLASPSPAHHPCRGRRSVGRAENGVAGGHDHCGPGDRYPEGDLCRFHARKG
eukprot:s20_g8.t1